MISVTLTSVTSTLKRWANCTVTCAACIACSEPSVQRMTLLNMILSFPRAFVAMPLPAVQRMRGWFLLFQPFAQHRSRAMNARLDRSQGDSQRGRDLPVGVALQVHAQRIAQISR